MAVQQIIAHIGFEGSGKSYASEILVREQKFKKLSFADCLRNIAFHVLNIRPAVGMKIYTKLKSTEIYNGLNFRNILENLGSAIRSQDKDFFARALVNEIARQTTEHSICIDDMRYTNEFLVLEDYCNQNNIKFTAVFCDYHSDRYNENNQHESTQLSRYLKQIGYKHGQIIDRATILTFNQLEKLRLNKKVLK